MTDYDSWVDTYEIVPPVGRAFPWGAKAKVKRTGTGRVDDFVTLSEHLGETKAEARAKAQQEADNWIEAERVKTG